MPFLDGIRRAVEEFVEDVRGLLAGSGGLRITVVDGPRNLTNCGAAEYQVRWSLGDMTKTGWIIQHIRVDSDVTDCAGNVKTPRVPDGLEFWEAWEVAGGQVWAGPQANGIPARPVSDTFRTPDEGPNTRGRTEVKGDVRFVENFNLTRPPWGNTVPEAGILPTITREPAGWSDVGSRDHDLVIQWVCCDETRTQTTLTARQRELLRRIIERLRRVFEALRRVFSRPIRAEDVPPTGPSRADLRPEVREAVDRLDEVPPWTNAPPEDEGTREEIVERLVDIANEDTETLREVVEGYVSVAQAERRYDTDAMSRLYALNRVAFDTPPRAEAGGPRFASFAGVPSGEEWVDEMWPLSETEDGGLRLTGEFHGYFGPPFLAVEEFDAFAERYGRRDSTALE